MSDLLNKKCVPCEGGVLPFDISEIHKYQKKVDGWDIIKDEKKNFFLNKKFNFQNFFESQEFVNKVGTISETEGHHPDITFGWGYAEIQISTHAIEGLSEKGDHPLQLAWIAEDVPQCGYCQSGQIMQAAALLKSNSDPTDEDIESVMNGNICRCGTYTRIKKAIKIAANKN